MSILKILFSFSGRIPRSTYWLSLLGLLVAMFFSAMAVVAVTMPNTANFDPATFDPNQPSAAMMGDMRGYFIGMGALTLFSLWPSLAISVKRLHDRNWSGWWIALPYGVYLIPIALMFMNPEFLAYASNPSGPPPSASPLVGTIIVAAVLISVVSGIWLFILMGFMRGTNSQNQFGEDPLGGMLAEGTPPTDNQWAG